MSADYGDPRLPERFWAKVRVNADTDCWMWQRSLNPNGYGQFRVDPVPAGPRGAHRVAYLALVGDVPDGMQLDHLCRVRACCNPAHLEPVSNRENSLRSPLRGGKSHCIRGHELSGPNVRLQTRGAFRRRECRLCARLRHSAEYRATK